MTTTPPTAPPTTHPTAPLADLLGPPLKQGVRAIMISTLSGSATLGENSQSLGNPTDTALLLALRDWADVVFVGAKTVKKENYSGVQPTPARPCPAPIAVPSRSLDFDPASDFLHNFSTPPIFLTPAADVARPEVALRAARLEQLGCTVIDCGEGTITDYLTALNERGFAKIACEGGPGILSQVIGSGALHQLYLTVDPHLTTAVELPLVYSKNQPQILSMTLENVWADSDGTVFLRYLAPQAD